MPGKMEVISRSGISFKVDASDEACLKFGFRHGDRVEHPIFGKATVMGVAHPVCPARGEGVLWCAFDFDEAVDKAVVGYCSDGLIH